MCQLRNIALESVTDGQTNRRTDGRTDDGKSDLYVSLCFAGDTKVRANKTICAQRAKICCIYQLHSFFKNSLSVTSHHCLSNAQEHEIYSSNFQVYTCASSCIKQMISRKSFWHYLNIWISLVSDVDALQNYAWSWDISTSCLVILTL